MAGADGRRPIVVGVDPDPSKRLALAWAADEADLRLLPLRLVHAFGWPSMHVPPGVPPVESGRGRGA